MSIVAMNVPVQSFKNRFTCTVLAIVIGGAAAAVSDYTPPTTITHQPWKFKITRIQHAIARLQPQCKRRKGEAKGPKKGKKKKKKKIIV
jgi:hypothetical protein